MTPEEETKIKDFVTARDAMLLSGDIDRAMIFRAKWFPNTPPFSSREEAEIALHRSRTGVTSLPIEVRRESKKWLLDRGHQSLDDGDL